MQTLLSLSSPANLSKRGLARLVVLVLTGAILVLFNASYRSERAPLQNDFDSWLQSTKETIATSLETAPQISVSLISQHPDFKADWRISLNQGGDPERLVRILDLAKEANVFSRSRSEDRNALRFLVSDGSREFATSLSPSDIGANVEAGNLIRLFQLYAVEMPEADKMAKLEGGSHTREAAPAAAEAKE
ncbi:MAG: hypothetical protein RL417_1245 [Pseudomonadota bacterium]|jgi:hypothetical protein